MTFRLKILLIGLAFSLFLFLAYLVLFPSNLWRLETTDTSIIKNLNSGVGVADILMEDRVATSTLSWFDILPENADCEIVQDIPASSGVSIQEYKLSEVESLVLVPCALSAYTQDYYVYYYNHVTETGKVVPFRGLDNLEVDLGGVGNSITNFSENGYYIDVIYRGGGSWACSERATYRWNSTLKEYEIIRSSRNACDTVLTEDNWDNWEVVYGKSDAPVETEFVQELSAKDVDELLGVGGNTFSGRYSLKVQGNFTYLLTVGQFEGEVCTPRMAVIKDNVSGRYFQLDGLVWDVLFDDTNNRFFLGLSKSINAEYPTSYEEGLERYIKDYPEEQKHVWQIGCETTVSMTNTISILDYESFYLMSLNLFGGEELQIEGKKLLFSQYVNNAILKTDSASEIIGCWKDGVGGMYAECLQTPKVSVFELDVDNFVKEPVVESTPLDMFQLSGVKEWYSAYSDDEVLVIADKFLSLTTR